MHRKGTNEAKRPDLMATAVMQIPAQLQHPLKENFRACRIDFFNFTSLCFFKMTSFFHTRKWKVAVFFAILNMIAYQAWAPFEAIFDYVVIGGGTAGITLGARLAHQGFRVAVVEAGGYYEIKRPLCRIPGAATLGAGASLSVASAVDWRFVARRVPGADYRDIHYPRGKCMGGSYVFYTAVLVSRE